MTVRGVLLFSWFRRWFWRMGLAMLLGLGFLYWASRTQAPVLPAGVTKEIRQMVLVGRSVSVTLYRPAKDERAPLVVVAHGFTRAKRYMAGWGADLAGQGFLVAVPTQPALANHVLNGQVLAALVEALRENRRVALMGFSMGGLTTLLAAKRTSVDAWVGLDPVDMDGSGMKAAAALHVPCAILRAEPEAWNLHGNALALAAVMPELWLSLKVRGATHLDAESPTDLLGQIACGFVEPEQQALFKRYAIAFLKMTLLGDLEERGVIQGVMQVDGLTEVELKMPKD